MNVKITSSSVSPYETRVTTLEGVAVEGLTGITFHADVDDVNRAELRLLISEISVEGRAQFYVRGKEVHRIEYADGSVDDFTATAQA